MCLRKFSRKISSVMQENFRKNIAACNISKNATSTGIFLPFFYPFQSFFSPLIQQVTLVPFKFMHAFIHQMKMQIFDPIARGNIDTTSACQMMSYSHIDLNNNEHLNLNLENKTPH